MAGDRCPAAAPSTVGCGVVTDRISRAAGALSEGGDLAPAELADRLTAQLLERAADDDVAILLYRPS